MELKKHIELLKIIGLYFCIALILMALVFIIWGLFISNAIKTFGGMVFFVLSVGLFIVYLQNLKI